MSIYDEAQSFLDRVAANKNVMLLGNPNLAQFQVAASVGAVDELIGMLQAVQKDYQARLEREQAVIDRAGFDPNRPARERRNDPKPKPHDPVKIKDDSALGHRFVNFCDLDLATMELFGDE